MRPSKEHPKQYRLSRAVESGALNSGTGGGVMSSTKLAGIVQYNPSNCTSTLSRRVDEFIKVLINGVYIEIF